MHFLNLWCDVYNRVYGKLIDLGEYNLYFLSTLIKTQVFTALRQDTAMFKKLF